MHPDMIWALTMQRIADMQADAEAAGRARLARRARKARRRQAAGKAAGPELTGAEVAGILAIPRIPDYADGTFREENELKDNSPVTDRPECHTRMAS